MFPEWRNFVSHDVLCSTRSCCQHLLNLTLTIVQVVQVWAPQHGGPFAIEGHSNPYLSLLWPFVLQHDILFEGVIALCLASWLMPQGIRASEDRAFIYHHNNTLAKLQQRLIDPQQCCDDVTLLTMTCLGTIDYVLGNSHGAIAHVEAMRQMIKMRGGQSGDTPWERHIQTQLFAYETMWSFVSEPNSSPVSPTRRPSERILRKRQLPIYPSHPFKPEICEILSKLPQGFSDLGLAGTFSVQMMSILADLSSIKIEEPSDNSIETQDKKNKIASELEDNVEDLLRLATLRTTTTEHYLCYGMVAYCVLLKLLYFPPSSGSFKNDELQNLVDQVVKCNSGVDDMNKNCYIWIVIVIAGCMQNCAHSISGRDQVLKKLFDKSRDAKDWRSMEKILKTFLWDNVIANICRSSWQEALYHYQNPVSPKELPRPSRMSIRDVIL